MIRSWYKESIYYRLYNILVVPYKKLLKKEGEGRAGSRIISSGWLRKKQKMSAIYFKALLQNGCDNWHPCQNALWAKRSSKNSNFLVKYRVFCPKTTLTVIMLYPNLGNTLQKKSLMKTCHFCGILLPTAKWRRWIVEEEEFFGKNFKFMKSSYVSYMSKLSLTPHIILLLVIFIISCYCHSIFLVNIINRYTYKLTRQMIL